MPTATTDREVIDTITVTDDDTEVTFRYNAPAPYDDEVHVHRNDDGSYRVSWLVEDHDRWEYEWDDPDTPSEQWSNGVFRDFRHQTYRGERGPDALRLFHADMVEAHGADNVHLVEVYSHGLESFSRVAAERFYPDRQWDVCAPCVLVTPPDVTDPAGWADGMLESYTSWCMGDVWGVVNYYVNPDGTVTDDDSCWGFIGHDNATEAMKGRW